MRKILCMAIASGVLLWAAAASAETCVRIDIKPFSCPNAISTNCDEDGPNANIAVAILGSCCVDVKKICSVTFTVNGNSSTGPQTPVRECRLADVNGDGRCDLVCHFSRCSLGIDCSTTIGTINGQFCEDGAFVGMDSIKPVPCNK